MNESWSPPPIGLFCARRAIQSLGWGRRQIGGYARASRPGNATGRDVCR
jgi:hypothetical protein